MVNAHATSTPTGDIAEAFAIQEIIKKYGFNRARVTANKGAMGHCFSSAGTIESIFAI